MKTHQCAKASWGTDGVTWRRQEVRQIEHSILWKCISHHCLTRLALASVLRPFGVYLLTFQSTRCIDALIGVTAISGYLCPRIEITENTWSFDCFWHSVDLQVFRSEGLLNLLSLLSQDFLLLSCLLCTFTECVT